MTKRNGDELNASELRLLARKFRAKAAKQKRAKAIEKGAPRRESDKGPDWSGITKNPHNLTSEQKRIIDSWG